ncbi:MAG: sugar-phosphate isomerase, RpiB/LacA/LacB family [Alphaproteobacteria bacterium]|nr:sugar-phosphate isomerase, RpiB/LacA/LacB family [Alphaproteobacteria bacterium]
MTFLKHQAVIASDHAGFPLKQEVAAWLQGQDCPLLDLGTDSTNSVDYPDFGQAAAQAILNGNAVWGVVICGTGIGISISANRFKWIRCALCGDVETAMLARRHNDANLLALAGRVLSPDLARKIVQAFAETAFEGGRHQERVLKIDAIMFEHE